MASDRNAGAASDSGPGAAFDLAAVGADVDRPDDTARSAAREQHAHLATPPGALGRLEDLSIWLAGVQSEAPPRPLRRVRVVVVAGDHGIAVRGVSAYPAEATARMVEAIARGDAAVNAVARTVGASVRVLDLAVDAETPTETQKYKIRRSSGCIDVEDALAREEAEGAFRAGMAIADEEIDSGADLLVVGNVGVASTTPAAALVGILASSDAASVVGRGTGIDDRTWMVKCAAIRDAMYRTRKALGDPIEVLATGGGADIAALAGLLVQAAARRTPVLLDGVVAAAAALVAQRVAFRTPNWQQAGQLTPEPAHGKALDRLSLQPLLDYRLNVGDGTGALLAVPLLAAAQATLAETATADEADLRRLDDGSGGVETEET